MREMLIKACIVVAVFFAGKRYESLFGDKSDYNKGFSDGFDRGMAFAKKNKDMIDHYKGRGVWEVGECEDDFKEEAK